MAHTSPLVLALSSDDPAYTTLTIHPNTAAAAASYTTETDYHTGKYPVTTLRNQDAQVVASLERHEVMSDVVILPDEGGSGQSSLILTKWMRPGLVKRSICAFEDKHGRKYEWRGYSIGQSLQLWAADTPSYPIAYFTKRGSPLHMPEGAEPSSHSTESLRQRTLPTVSATATPKFSTLILQPRALDIQDLVVSSFLFLERNRRIREAMKHKSPDSASSGWGGAIGSVAT